MGCAPNQRIASLGQARSKTPFLDYEACHVGFVSPNDERRRTAGALKRSRPLVRVMLGLTLDLIVNGRIVINQISGSGAQQLGVAPMLPRCISCQLDNRDNLNLPSNAFGASGPVTPSDQSPFRTEATTS